MLRHSGRHKDTRQAVGLDACGEITILGTLSYRRALSDSVPTVTPNCDGDLCCTRSLHVVPGGQVSSRQQKQPAKEGPEHEAHRECEGSVDLLKIQARQCEDVGILKAL
jgi:hypothetical protein